MAVSAKTGVHRFAIATAGFTVLLLMAGALVTSNDAADSVPDWPLAYGKIIPPLVGGIRYEFTHRVVAFIVAMLATALAIWLAGTEKRAAVRRLGWTALALVVAQALLGAARVKLGHPPLIATFHATVAQIFFITTVALALYTSPWSLSDQAPHEDRGSPHLRSLALWTTIIIFVQLILGAGFRHGAFGILPHLIGAVAVTFFVIWTGRTAKKRFANVPAIRRSVVWLHATFGTQILLGFTAYWAVAKAINEAQPTLPYVILTVAHVLVGALTLASSVILTLICYRLLRPSGAVELSSQASGAAV
ncbi:MAG: COX15/CtaA family protein [Candidatus Acidiferrales bacterium]